MPDSELPRDPLEELAEEFLRRYRCGDRPAVSEFAQRHPELAAAIHDVFPMLAMMEEAGAPPAKPVRSLAPAVTADGRPLEQLGDYRIIRELGRGGMGVVYEAEHLTLGRQVALKVLLYQATTDELRLKRFWREARAVARLHHTNIVPVFEVGECQGMHFYAMQLIRGRPLDRVLAELRAARQKAPALDIPLQPASTASVIPASASITPLEDTAKVAPQSDFGHYRDVARLGLQVAEALAYVHSHNIMHRDIKPSNLLVAEDGTVWVTDFGLAKDEGELLTRTGDMVGTLRYMAPERFKGQADARGDVYALGITLYEVLALEPPFAAVDRAALIGQISEQPPRPLRGRVPGLPRDLETIVHKAMAREPDARYASAAALAADLRSFLDNRPIQARRASVLERAWRWCRRRPAVAALIATALLLLVSVASISTIYALRLDAANKAKDEQLRLKEEAKIEAQQWLYQSLVTQAQALHWSRRPGRRLGALAALNHAASLARRLGLDAAEFRSLRNEAIEAMTAVDLDGDTRWPGYPEHTIGIAVSRDYQQYARIDDHGHVSVRLRIPDEEVCVLEGATSSVEDVRVALAFSPTGRFLTAWYRTRAKAKPLLVWDLQRRQRTPAWSRPDVSSFAAFAPDARTVAVGFSDGAIAVFGLQQGREVRRLQPGLRPWRLSFDPGGRRLAIGSRQAPYAQIRDAVTGAVLCMLPHQADVAALDWSPDGQTLATGCNDHNIYLWDGQTGTKVGTLRGHLWELKEVAFSHSGNVLVSTSFDSTTRLWDIRNRQLLCTYPAGRRSQFSPDDRWAGFVVDQQAVKLLRFTKNPEYRVIPVGPHALYTLAFSGDGRALLSMGEAGAQLWDATTGRHLGDFPGTGSNAALFDTAHGCLLAYGKRRLNRWPYPTDQGAAHRSASVQSPAPEILWQLEKDQGCDGMAWVDPAKQTLVLGVLPKGLVLFDVSNRRPITSFAFPHDDLVSIQVSRDGRWLAAADTDRHGYQVWDLHTGAVVLRQPGGAQQFLAFSPDSKWLAASEGAGPRPAQCRLWRTGSWQIKATLPCNRTSSGARVEFTPDGSLLAITTTSSDITLVEPTTLVPIAELRSPEPVFTSWLAFTSDGSQLAVATLNHKILIWDLKQIRRTLAEMGLDWDSSKATSNLTGP